MPTSPEPYRPDAPIVAELAAGAVIVSEVGVEVLLLHQKDEDRWCFPKGHVDPGESLGACALREIREETGLDAVELDAELGEVSYRFFRSSSGQNVYKSVVYFLARTRERAVRPEPIFDRYDWVPVATAVGRLRYDTDRRMLATAARRLSRPPPSSGPKGGRTRGRPRNKTGGPPSALRA